jgi:regulator of sigma E protease
MNIIQTILAFLLALGPLIVFHELGHYLVARLCGVKVLRFSLGIGKVVWSRRFGKDGTEWAVSMFPLGGYVKMLDARDPDGPRMTAADAGREFTSQSVWRRIAIIAAGPIANFILAILIFSGLFMHGVDEAGTRIRSMAANTAASQAGLRGGDQVKAVNGVSVATWSEMRWEMLQAVVDKREARIDVERPDAGQYSFVIPNSAMAKLDAESDVLANVGLMMHLPPARLVELSPEGPAAKAGLR